MLHDFLSTNLFDTKPIVFTVSGQNVDGQNVDGQDVSNFGNIGQNIAGRNVPRLKTLQS